MPISRRHFFLGSLALPAFAAKKPPATAHDFELLIEDIRALLSPSRDVNEFWKRYSGAVQRDPGVAVLHEKIEKELASHGTA